MPTKQPQQSAQSGQFSDADLAQPEGITSSPDQGEQPSMLQRAGKFGSDVLQGLGESGISLMSTGDQFARKHLPAFLTNSNMGFGPPANLENVKRLATPDPDNTTQAVSKGLGDAAQFLIPGGAEEKAAANIAGGAKLLGATGKTAKAVESAAPIATGALSTGLVNKAQGGDFSTGAAAGAGGAALGAGMKAAAPMVAESALGIPKAARAFGKTPGKAILEETRGIRPETIASSAKERLGQLNPELEAKYAASPNTAFLKPSRDFLDQEMNKAVSQNARGLHGQLNNMANTLHENFATGQRIPQDVPPSDLLNLKRGFGEEHTSWNPEVSNRALGAGRHTYGLLDQAGDKAVPEGAELNQRISSLIPVSKRAESVSRNNPTVQRALGRFGAHTGALTLGGLGAAGGYKEGGIPGAVAGGVTGVLAPELIASPEGQMAAARLLGKANTLKPATGLLLQGTRGNQ